MGFYACSTKPMINDLGSINDSKQVWFADDATAAGIITDLYGWWMRVSEIGPHYGYYPNASKTYLIVKPEYVNAAKSQFEGTGVIVTTDGKRHLGAAIGSLEFKEEYVRDLVDKWVGDIESLSDIAKVDPHSAYAAYSFGLRHKWTYSQRTIPDTSSLYEPLETIIATKFIPALLTMFTHHVFYRRQ